MKLTHSLAALAAASALLFPLTSTAAGPELRIPDFSHLRDGGGFRVYRTRRLPDELAKKFAAADAGDRDESLVILSAQISAGAISSSTRTMRIPARMSNQSRNARARAGSLVRTMSATRGRTPTFSSILPTTRSWVWPRLERAAFVHHREHHWQHRHRQACEDQGHSASQYSKDRVIRQIAANQCPCASHRARRIDFPAAAGA